MSDKTVTAVAEINNELDRRMEFWRKAIDKGEGIQSSLYVSILEEVKVIKRKVEEALPTEREQMEDIERKAIERVIKSAKVTYTPCGDISMCGCQGTCERPIAIVDKKPLRALLKQSSFDNHYTQTTKQ